MLDLEKLKEQPSLSEADDNKIYQEAMREIEQAEKGNEEGKEEEPKKEGDDDEGNEMQGREKEVVPDPDEEKKKKEEESKKSQEEKEKKEEEKKPDEKPAGDEKKEKEEENGKEEKISAEKQFELEVKEYAEKENVPEETARKILEGEKSIAEKYANDPRKLSRAYRHQQAEFTRVEMENRMLKGQLESNFLNPPKIVIRGKEYTQEEAKELAIQGYREAHEEQTADLEDAEVWKLARQEISKNYEQQRNAKLTELSAAASKRKLELITEISDSADKKYLPEIKEMLKSCSDAQLADPNFNLKDIVFLLKGVNAEKDIKDAEDRGYKRGLEQAKILGEKTPVGSGKPPPKKEGSKKLSDTEMKRAKEMFGDSGLTEEQIIEFYLDYKKDTEDKK